MSSSKCIYPAFDGRGEFYIGEHDWDKDGFCCVCGLYNPKEKEPKRGKNSVIPKDF